MSQSRGYRVTELLAVSLSVLALSCGKSGNSSGISNSTGGSHHTTISTGGSDAGGSPSPTGQGDITVALGGVVSAGAARLTVPPNSVNNNVSITVATSQPGANLPDRSTIHGLIYDFGPDGTRFNPPALLALPIVGTPARGEAVVVSWLDETAGSWIDLNTSVMGSTATASVAHFTSFAVRFIAPHSTTQQDAGLPSDAGDGSTGSDGGMSVGPNSAACPLGTWSLIFPAGQGTCDGGAGLMSLIITQGPNNTFLVAENLNNIVTGPACDWEMSGSATLDGKTLTIDLVRDDNGCTKHGTVIYTIDAACKTMTTNGDFTDKNCESCMDPTAQSGSSGCFGCGTVSCTTNSGMGSLSWQAYAH